MGVFIELLARRFNASNELKLFVATGVLGGFTTFSAFSLDTALYYERGEIGSAALYVAVSVVLSIAALFGGLFVVRQLA
jgi:CrcB protein